MPRQPKPYYRKPQQRRVCIINGECITLGKAEADSRFRDLVANKDAVPSAKTTRYDLSQLYLDWVQDTCCRVIYMTKKVQNIVSRVPEHQRTTMDTGCNYLPHAAYIQECWFPSDHLWCTP